MDTKNRYHTDSTYLHERLEQVAVVIICAVLTLMHVHELNWWRFIAAFLIIDLIGYIPGAVAFHRHGGGRIPPVYHYLYNITHSYLTAVLLVGLWAIAIGRFEWAMMAFPIHLSGDRGIFGNIFKPIVLHFEPVETAPPQAIGRASGAD
jgi:hypothetical protein